MDKRVFSAAIVVAQLGVFVTVGVLAFGGVAAAAARSNATKLDAARQQTSATSSLTYHKIGLFQGTRSAQTKTISVPAGNKWLLHWNFNCRGVARPAFVASGFHGSHHDATISIFRDRRTHASGAIPSQQIGTFHFRVSSNCLWRLVVYRAHNPPAERPTAVAKAPVDEHIDPFAVPAFENFIKTRLGNITAAVYNAETGETLLYRPGVTEQTASIVKIDILGTLLQQAQTGRGLSDEDRDLATGMVEDSDNDDATALWNAVGGAKAVARFDAFCGLSDTSPGPDGFWGETTTTALDQVNLVKHVAFANDVLSDASRNFELGLMEHIVDYEDWGVSAGPANDVTVALKNGWLPLATTNWQINSIGYVDAPQAKYVIAILTSGNPTEEYGISTIEGLSKMIWAQLELPHMQ